MWKDLQGKEKMRFPKRTLEPRGRYNECGKDGKPDQSMYRCEEKPNVFVKNGLYLVT